MSKQHLGHTARKRFGQNFLHDPFVIGEIVDAINPQDGEKLVEIGPGLGALTEPVCERVSALTVVELDRDLAQRLRTHPFIQNKLTIIENDAMKVDFAAMSGTEKSLRIFGNLPYNISTPLMFHLFQFADQVQDMHFMLQKEVVDRMAASPGSKDYGRLSVMSQYHCQVQPVLQVPPGAFKPAPKVDSAVVRLLPYATPPVAVTSPVTLNQVCAAAFNQRRKTIRNSLRQFIDAEALSSLDIDPGRRAETLSLEEYARVANAVEN